MDNIPIGQNRVQQAFPAEKQDKERFITSGSFVIYQNYSVKIGNSYCYLWLMPETF